MGGEGRHRKSPACGLRWRPPWAMPWGLAGMLTAACFPPGRATLGPGPIYPEGPQHPEGAAGGSAGGTCERTAEMSHVAGEAASRGSQSPAGMAEGRGGPRLGPGSPPHAGRCDPTGAALKIRRRPGLRPDPTCCPAETKARRPRQPQARAGGGGRKAAGLAAPSPGPSLPAAPPQELWRSSFLHHGNRCSCFHWPGASLMLLAVLLLLGCHGGQPAGR